MEIEIYVVFLENSMMVLQKKIMSTEFQYEPDMAFLISL